MPGAATVTVTAVPGFPFGCVNPSTVSAAPLKLISVTLLIPFGGVTTPSSRTVIDPG